MKKEVRFYKVIGMDLNYYITADKESEQLLDDITWEWYCPSHSFYVENGEYYCDLQQEYPNIKLYDTCIRADDFEDIKETVGRYYDFKVIGTKQLKLVDVD